MVDFLVVKAHSSYNAIIRQPTLNNLKPVTSTYHLKMNFLIKDVIRVVRGEQVVAWECYMQGLQGKEHKEPKSC